MTSIDELTREYEALFAKETKIDEDLQLLLNNQNLNQSRFNNLRSIIPKVQLIYNDSNNLSNMIKFTTNLADNVSSKVRVLDIAKGRVTGCIKRVTDILDLKECTDGVTLALEEEDYETAANHIHRYLSLDKESLRLKTNSTYFTNNNNEKKQGIDQYNAESYYLEHSFNLLQESKIKLQKIVEDKYNQALVQDDVPQLERFFKIFPLIGQSQNGLTKFSSYLCLQITQAAEKNFEVINKTSRSYQRWNIMFADALTLLYEKVAQVIEAYQPVIQTYYGHGNMILFIRNIQKECDLQALRILEKFKHVRSIATLFRKIQNDQSGIGNSSIDKLEGEKNPTDKIDPRDLDELLTEITLISSRSELYKSFLLKSIINDLGDKEVSIDEAEKFIQNCNLSFAIQELIGQYSIIENYFMIENVTKAIQMDTIMAGSKTSSVVDDVFFIIKKCIKRCLYSDSVDGCCAMFNNCTTVLDSIYKDYFYSQLKLGFTNTFTDLAQAYTAIQRRFQLTEQQIEEEKRKFLVTLNNIEESIEFISALKNAFEEDISKLFAGVSKSSKEKLNSCLSDLGAVGIRLKQLNDFGFNQLTTNDLKPRIKQWMEAYQSINHKMNEEEFSQYSSVDPFMQNLIRNIEHTLDLYKAILTEKNQDILVGQLALQITASLEKNIYKCIFSRYGGIHLDKDLRVLINFLAGLTSWSIREKFARLTQIAIILSLETLGELFEYWNSPLTITWRLTPNEIRQILLLRHDFKSAEIKALNL